MLKEEGDYIIRIKGLTPGSHSFEYNVGVDFFQSFDNQQIMDSNLKAEVEVERVAGIINLHIEIDGHVVVPCDRCLDEVEVAVNSSEHLTVKFADVDEQQYEDETILLPENESEFDLKQHIYDYVCLSLPIAVTHPKGKCNKQMIEKLNARHDSQPESPFGKLKDLLKE